MATNGKIPARSERGAATVRDGLEVREGLAVHEGLGLREGLDALRRSARATDALLGSVSDGQGDTPVSGLAWAVAEVAAHLVALLNQSAAYTSGARDGAAERAALPPSGNAAERLALGNARELEVLAERRIPVLRRLLAAAVDEYATAISGRGGDGPIETLLGQEDPAAMTAGLVGEQLVHGFDLARALGRPAAIDPDAARLALAGSAPLLPYFVDAEAIRDVSARIEIRIAGGSRFALVLERGRAAVEPADGRCDCWIRVEPVPYLLLAFGRIGRVRPLLRRQVRSGGRRPWIAMRLASYLTSI